MLIRLDEAHIPAHTRDFYDALAEQGYQERQQNSSRFRRVVDIVRATAGTYDLVTCLEVGCAEGLMTDLIAPVFDEMLALDISPRLIAKAREHETGNCRYGVVDIEATRLLELNHWDLIVLSEVLEHLRDPQAVVARCLRASRYVVASCPINEAVNADAFNVALYGHEEKWADATGHIWAMDEVGFKSLFDGHLIESFEVAEPCAIAVVKGEQ